MRLVLDKLGECRLFLKCSKCSFGERSISYLRDVISEAGVMDEQKVQAVLAWPLPMTVQAVRAFLGLAGYYWHFIRDYGAMAPPLTALMRKDGFLWTS